MRLCDKHYKKIKKRVGSGKEREIVNAISKTMLLFFNGDDYDWNPNMVFYDIETHFNGCPVCALGEEYEGFLEGYIMKEYDYDEWKNSRKEND